MTTTMTNAKEARIAARKDLVHKTDIVADFTVDMKEAVAAYRAGQKTKAEMIEMIKHAKSISRDLCNAWFYWTQRIGKPITDPYAEQAGKARQRGLDALLEAEWLIGKRVW